MKPRGQTLLCGIDIQTAGKVLIYTVHGDASFRNFHCNTTGGRPSVTKGSNVSFIGAKLDFVSVGRRFMLTLDTGQMAGCSHMAYGGGFEATIWGRDYDVGDDKVTLTTTFLSLDKDVVPRGSIRSDFHANRIARMSASAKLNSTKSSCFISSGLVS